MEKLRIELAVLLMISLVAFGGFISTPSIQSSDDLSGDYADYEEIGDSGNEITGEKSWRKKLKKAFKPVTAPIRKVQAEIHRAVKRDSPKPVVLTPQSPKPVLLPVSPAAPKPITCGEYSGGKAKCTWACEQSDTSLDIIHGSKRGVFDCKSNEYCCEYQGRANKPNNQLTCKQAAKKNNHLDGLCSRNPYSSVPCAGVFSFARVLNIGRTTDCNVCCAKVK